MAKVRTLAHLKELIPSKNGQLSKPACYVTPL
ncbi:MAG: hypothetical protein ACI8UP_003994, partial [Porticoccaceae bacterium]